MTSIWNRLSEALHKLRTGTSLSEFFGMRPPEYSVGFTIAVLALGAKMAKADGQVTRDEVVTFRKIFHIAPEDLHRAGEVFDRAREDVAGYQHYAAQIARMFSDRPHMLEDILDGLFAIAMADGQFHPAEESFLADVAAIFGISPGVFARLKLRHATDGRQSPYEVLGVDPNADWASITAARRKLLAEVHPDRLMARGLPPEAVALGQHRAAAINHAYEQLKLTRITESPSPPAESRDP